MPAAETAIAAAQRLSRAMNKLEFDPPVECVYNPLTYAWAAHEAYLRQIPPGGVRVLMLGMNPGPWGMAQTGVPFGQVAAVRDWMKIDAPIKTPKHQHPKRPINGLACERSEVSGERLWGLMQARFKTPKRFFKEHLVANYCPLAFMEESGRNRTPDHLPASERAPITELCDKHLAELIKAVQPEWAVGVGKYAEKCLLRVAGDSVKVTTMLHPSPASPAANRGWAEAAIKQLEAAGVW
ncbi:Uracil DNA glycosylase superfamily protein [Posidoniimonas polymericola]|uniref:Uracil DNA glycosylase superfamily protein n=1 Tax=Posidoniimonas polymericola TaxID=2528002 RepID=A0A5C5YBK6_9BACT|nr:uracil-DNA glycosylase family protein [Posidoniimonas polymericola]TWT72770.1 Uracil DNA glycosylase superfamily protein [Posidoniimonas polymericola]